MKRHRLQDHTPALIGWTDDDGQVVTEVYDPGNPVHRELARLLAQDCPECCAALLAEPDAPLPGLPQPAATG